MYKDAWRKIVQANSILLVSHVRPDGDTLGSVLALYSLLKSLKKRVHVYNPSKNLPKHLNFLPNFHKISNEVKDFDLAIVCDCGSTDRTKICLKDKAIINIDHHKTNEHFGDINIVKPKMPSTTLVVYKMLQKNDIPITKDIATCIYVGFLEDTGFFSYGNIDKKVFKMIGKLVKSGMNTKDIHTKLTQSLPLSVLRLRQHIYNTFSLYKNGTIAVAIIENEDLKKSGCEIENTKNMVNLLRELVSVKLSVLLIKMEQKGYKVSLRSKGELDVSVIAQKFGGGGHQNAAGFETDLNKETIIKKIIG